MNRISDYLLDLRNKIASRGDGVKRYTQKYEKTNHIGILFHIKNDDMQPKLNEFVAKLRKDEKKLELLTYIGDQIHSNPYNFQYNVFTNKDISVLGSINSAEVEHFISQNFDYLFCIYLEHFNAFDNILLKSKAKLRIGKYFEDKEDCLDLMLNIPEDKKEDELMDMLFYYIKKLN